MRTHALTGPIAFFVLVLVPSISPAVGQVNQQAINDVAAGKLKVAIASWWGFDPADSTKALQAAINSGVPKLTVDNVGQPWIVEPIRLASNQEITFEKGVEVLAKQGAFRGTNDALFRADNLENITLIGYGATLRMRRSDYDAPPYQKAEWRHVLTFRSCSNIKVYGLTLAESGGDGIYLGTATKGVTNKNVHIKDVICDRNYRQGISVITAENLLIENTILRDTAGTPPQAGIDFEPNNPDERLVNCVMRDCISQGNVGAGYVLYLVPLSAQSEPISVRFENCKALGNAGPGASIATGNTAERAVDGKIEFVRCSFEGSGRSGFIVRDKPANRCPVRLVECSILDTSADTPAPILFMSTQGATEPIGGVEFADCLVRDAQHRNPMGYSDAAGGVPLSGISGTLILERNGARETVSLTAELLAQWMPVTALKAFPRLSLRGIVLKPLATEGVPKAYSLSSVRLRRAGRFVLYAAQGDQVSFRVRYLPVARYTGTTLSVTVAGPSDAPVSRVEVPFRQEAAVAFTAPETGIYRIAADPGQNAVQVADCSHPICLNGESGPISLLQSPGDYLFWVPAGTTEFGVRVTGEGTGEAIKAALINPAGEVVEEVDNVTQTHQFEVALAQPSRGEIWTLRLSRPSEFVCEDHYVDLRGIPPLLALAREALLVPVQP